MATDGYRNAEGDSLFSSTVWSKAFTLNRSGPVVHLLSMCMQQKAWEPVCDRQENIGKIDGKTQQDFAKDVSAVVGGKDNRLE